MTVGKYFMNNHGAYFELTNPGSAIELATDCAKRLVYLWNKCMTGDVKQQRKQNKPLHIPGVILSEYLLFVLIGKSPLCATNINPFKPSRRMPRLIRVATVGSQNMRFCLFV